MRDDVTVCGPYDWKHVNIPICILVLIRQVVKNVVSGTNMFRAVKNAYGGRCANDCSYQYIVRKKSGKQIPSSTSGMYIVVQDMYNMVHGRSKSLHPVLNNFAEKGLNMSASLKNQKG